MQEFTGQGNAASKQRLEEYKVVTDILKSRPKELNDTEKELLAKNSIGDNLQFNEYRTQWKHILKSRLGGVAATTTLGVGLGLAIGTRQKWLDFNGFAENKLGKAIGDKVLKPVFGSYVEDHKMLGKYAFIEMLYTAASKLGFDRIERQQFKKRQEEGNGGSRSGFGQGRESALTQQGGESYAAEPRTSFAAQTGRAPALDTRRKILEGGERDFRARESVKPGDAAVAIS